MKQLIIVISYLFVTQISFSMQVIPFIKGMTNQTRPLKISSTIKQKKIAFLSQKKYCTTDFKNQSESIKTDCKRIDLFDGACPCAQTRAKELGIVMPIDTKIDYIALRNKNFEEIKKRVENEDAFKRLGVWPEKEGQKLADVLASGKFCKNFYSCGSPVGTLESWAGLSWWWGGMPCSFLGLVHFLTADGPMYILFGCISFSCFGLSMILISKAVRNNNLIAKYNTIAASENAQLKKLLNDFDNEYENLQSSKILKISNIFG